MSSSNQHLRVIRLQKIICHGALYLIFTGLLMAAVGVILGSM